MDQPVGVAVVGLGFWGEVLAEAVGRTQSMRLVACVSRRPARAREVAARLGSAALPSLEAALDHPEVEAVILATENASHGQGILAAAQAGRHVFVEKPITNTIEEAHKAAETMRAAGLVLAVGHEFRYSGAVRAMKQLLDEGAIGEVVLAEAHYSLPARFQPGSWNSSRAGSPGGTLMQIGIHHLDTLTYLLGPATVAAAVLERRATEAEVPTVAAVTLRHAEGATSVVTSSFVTPWSYFINLYGTRGALFYEVEPGQRVLADRQDTVSVLRRQHGDGVEFVPFEPRDMLVAQFEDFAAAIRTGGRPEVGAAEAIAALDLVWQAIRAAAPPTHEP